MDPLAVIAMVSTKGGSALARSALPDAPVVPPAARTGTMTSRVRAAFAAGLRRLADVLAPAQTTVCAD